MRQIELLAKVLAKVIGLEIKESIPDALKTVDNELKSLVGIDYDLVNTLTESELLSYLNINRDKGVVTAKCIIIAKLLKKRAELNCRIDESYNPSDSYRKALMLLTQGVENCTIDNEIVNDLNKDREELHRLINETKYVE